MTTEEVIKLKKLESENGYGQLYKDTITNAEWCLNKGIKFADIMLQCRKKKYGGGYNVARRDTREIIGYFVPPHFTEEDYKDKVLSNYAFELWLDQEHEDYKEPEEILTSEERGYLKQVIRPFKDKVEYIVLLNENEEYQYLELRYKNTPNNYLCQSPLFEKGKFFNGMQSRKKYTLEDLEL